MQTIRTLAALLALAPTAFAQTLYTPTEYRVTLYSVGLSTNGTDWVTAMESTAGHSVDLADAASFARALGQAKAIPAGKYGRVRMTLSTTLTWSHPAAPVSLSNQTVTVNGPPGPAAGQMTVYFATHDQGGRPSGKTGGDGTAAKPLLLGAPADVRANASTVLRLVFAVSKTLKDQGGGDYDLAPPLMFFVAENDSASELSGTFNTVLYNTRKKTNGTTVSDWSFLSGHGQLVFDGAGNWTWTGTTNEYDLLNTTGSKTPAVNRNGRYGVNANGSFWMTANGEPGTLHGAVSSDGTMMFASMYDSPSSHMMMFGTRLATAANVLNVTGGYYFTTYGSSYNAGSNLLKYRSSFGIVTGDGTGAISGTQDTNELQVTDPNGTPSITPPATSLGTSFSDTLTVSANGGTTNSGGGLGGAFLQSGKAASVAWDFRTTYEPKHEFGFLVQQSAGGTFSLASLNGTYFGGHFGDVYETAGGGSSNYFSGFFKVVFDGLGNATVTVVENEEGVVETRTFAQKYTVDGTSGTVGFTDPNGDPSSLKGAIGPGAESFILTARQRVDGQPNKQRFLGLGLLQK